MDNNPSVLSHVSIGTNDFERAIAFYDAVLPTLGCKRLMEHPGAIASLHGYVLAYGKQYPEFWVGTLFDGQPATVGNGTHISFIAPTIEAVHAFYEAALAVGGKDEGTPGSRPKYSEPYYGCFVRDPDSVGRRNKCHNRRNKRHNHFLPQCLILLGFEVF